MQLSSQIDEILNTGQRALEAEVSQGFRSLDAAAQKLEAMAREAMQAQLKTHYKPLLDKLESGASLTPDEQKMVELLIVGEAKYYVHHENDLENWKQETRRLLAEMQQLKESGLDSVDKLMKLRALCADARRVVPDLAFFYQEKERVDRFENATQGGIDRESGQILASLIREMMVSDSV